MKRRAGFTLIELMIVIAIIAILAGILIPNFVRARAQGQLSACQSNLKNIGTALESYATDNGGRYAGGLGAVAPTYLKSIPTCPAVGTVTYIANFTVSSNPDMYTVMCTGNNHSGAGQTQLNYPQYCSTSGLNW